MTKDLKWPLLLIISIFTYGCASKSEDLSETKDSIPTIPVTELDLRKPNCTANM
jgi:membrane fusion protein (multidrug efflux system)